LVKRKAHVDDDGKALEIGSVLQQACVIERRCYLSGIHLEGKGLARAWQSYEEKSARMGPQQFTEPRIV
jgi:hypothetical protein